MLAMNAPRDRGVGAYDVVVTAVAAGYIPDKVLAGGQVEGCPFAQDQPQRQKCLRRNTVLIRSLVGDGINGATVA